MALGKRKRQAGKMKVGRAAARMEGGTGRATGWIETAFRMGVSRPVRLLTKRLQPSDVGRLVLPDTTGIDSVLPLMLRRDEVDAMAGASGLKLRVLDAAGLEHTMYLKTLMKNNSASCQLTGTQCRAFINKNLIRGARRHDVVVSVWAFRANTPGWRYRSPDEDPLWYARDLCLVITATTDVDRRDEDAAFDVREARGRGPPPMDSWRGVRPKPRSRRRMRVAPKISDCGCIAAPPSPTTTTIALSSSSSCIDHALAGGEHHWVLDTSHGRGPLVLRFIRLPKPIV